jgi:NAD(P)-dependent dehydrogenase (short-subunit alcohol dehydrogenase family)
MSKLSGKWVLITGASRGVGRQIALGLAEHGCRLILHGREASHCEPLRQALAERGVEARALGAELSNAAEVDTLIDRVLADPGRIDILYNNAAIMTPWREAHTTPTEDYRLSFEVNVIALTRLCDRLLPGMKERGWGRIVNVTSGIQNIRELLPYSMSKAAVDRYVRDVSPSLEGTGVVMSLMDPGWLRTDLGGDKAPNAVETCLPGVLVPLLAPDATPSGKFYCAQDYRTDLRSSGSAGVPPGGEGLSS